MRLRYHVGVNRTVFNMMLQLGFLRDVITYDALFNACAKGQLTERTLLLFHRCGSCDSSLMWSPAALVSACEMDWKTERVVLESLLFWVSGVWGCFGFLACAPTIISCPPRCCEAGGQQISSNRTLSDIHHSEVQQRLEALRKMQQVRLGQWPLKSGSQVDGKCLDPLAMQASK